MQERRKSKHRYHDSPSPSSDYYDDRYRRRHRDSYNSRDRDNRRTYRDRSDRSRTRSESPKRGKRRRTTPVKIKIIEEGMTQRGGLSMRVLKRMKETGGPMDPMDTGRVIIVMTVSASGSGMTTSLLPDIFLTIIQLLTFGHHRHLHFLQQLL